MEIKRRGFVASIGIAGAAGLLQPAHLLAQALDIPGETLTLEDFQARLSQWLYLHAEGSEHQGNLRLVVAKDQGSTAELQQFNLILVSYSGAEALPTGHYKVAGEPFDLYVKHSGTFWGIQVYTAEFALLM